MKNILLFDFNSIDINKDVIHSGVNDLFKKIDTIGILYGELNPEDNLDIMAKQVSHSIKNLKFLDNKIYGDIEILLTKSGSLAKLAINERVDYEFKMRYVMTPSNLTIFTWDLFFNFDEEKINKTIDQDVTVVNFNDKKNIKKFDSLNYKNKSQYFIDDKISFMIFNKSTGKILFRIRNNEAEFLEEFAKSIIN